MPLRTNTLVRQHMGQNCGASDTHDTTRRRTHIHTRQGAPARVVGLHLSPFLSHCIF